MATYYVGQTIRATIKDLTDPDGIPLLTPTVSVAVTKPDGSIMTPPVTRVGSVYHSDFYSTTPGTHEVRVTAEAAGGTWKDEDVIYIHDFV
jgi:hypothetical protein